MDACIPKHLRARRTSHTVTVFTVLVGMAACAVGPDFKTPAPPTSSGYLATDTDEHPSVNLPSDQRIGERWWEIFGSAELNQLIDVSLANSPTVRAASARLRQSEAARSAGNSIFFPTVGVDLGANRQLASPIKLGGAGPGSLFNLYTLSGTVGYTLDLVGGQRRTLEALNAAVDYQRMIARATRITLVATIINTGVALAGYREQIDASRAVVADDQALIGLTAAQVKAGTSPEAALLALQSQLSNQQIALSTLMLQAAETEHLLSTLIGQEPGAGVPASPPLRAFAEPHELPLTLPSQLVRQRPDILAAEAQWHIASADVGVATAALFPSLTVTGSLGHDSTQWSELTGPNGKFWAGGADLNLPLFTGGRVWFGRKAALAAYEAAASDYRQTVLTGLAQVADVLAALNQDRIALSAARESEGNLAVTLQLVDATTRTGATGEASRLYADIAAQSARGNRISAEARYLQDIVALYVALGGSWSPDPAIGQGSVAP